MYSAINHIAYFNPLQKSLSQDTVEVVKNAGLKLSTIFILGHQRCCNFSAIFLIGGGRGS